MDRIFSTLYGDNSGGSGWCSPYGNDINYYHTSVGVELKPEDDLKVKCWIANTLKTFVQRNVQKTRPSEEYELHFSHMRSAKGLYRMMTCSDRLQLMNKIVEFVIDLKPFIFVTTINKLEHRKLLGFSASSAYLTVLKSTINKFSLHLNHHNRIGAIMYDNDGKHNTKPMQEMMRDFYASDNISQGSGPSPDLIPRITNNIDFGPSHFHPGIQLADFIAGVIWRKYEYNDNEWYDKLDPLWKYNEAQNQYYKDKVIPNID